MPTVTFEDGLKINFESEPSPQDIEEAYQQARGNQTVSTSSASRSPIAGVPGYDQVEKAIANRGSGIGFLRAATQDPTLVKQHPFVTALSTVGLPFEAGESAAANTALALQRGEPQNIGRDITAGFRGERPAQFGDVFRSVNVPEPVASVLGLTLMPGGAQLEEMLGKGGVNLAKGGMSLAKTGIKGTAQTAKNVVEFLKGNPSAIQTAKQELAEAVGQSAKQLDSDAYDFVKSYRRRGVNHADFFEKHGELSDAAYEPVKQVARGVTTPTPLEELKSTIASAYSDDPTFQSKANLTLDEYYGEVAKKSNGMLDSQTLIEKARDLGQQVRAAVYKGTVPRDEGEQLVSAIRSAVAKSIEARAPENLKGLYQEGLDQWASHAADTRRLFRILKPGASMEEPTAEGVSFIKKVVTGEFDTDRDTQDFMDRIRKNYGIDFPRSVTKAGERISQAETNLLQAKRVGARGAFVRKQVLPNVIKLLGLDWLLRRR